MTTPNFVFTLSKRFALYFLHSLIALVIPGKELLEGDLLMGNVLEATVSCDVDSSERQARLRHPQIPIVLLLIAVFA